MPIFEWNDKFSVNIDAFDSQHKNLVNNLNDLYDAMKQGRGNDVIGKIFSSLINYTQSHFKDELEMMKKHDYPDLLIHKKEHDDLESQIKELKEKFDNKQILVSFELLTFLKEWLMHHILETDKKYGPYLNGRGIK
jgi:hemerythrin